MRGRAFGPMLLPSYRVGRLLRWSRRLNLSNRPLSGLLGGIVRYRLAKVWGVFVHPSADVGDVLITHPVGVVIGSGSVVADGCILYQNVTLGAIDRVAGGYPKLEEGVTVFAGASILGDVVVGENAVVGAHSLVLNDVPAGATVAGAPARIVSEPDDAGG